MTKQSIRCECAFFKLKVKYLDRENYFEDKIQTLVIFVFILCTSTMKYVA